MGFPLGASVEIADLEGAPYEILAELQRVEPVSWVPAIGSWLITGRREAVEAMKDSDRFTVNDPRFTTAAVLGDSMLNLEGHEHARHRAAFERFFRPKAVRSGFEEWLEQESDRLIEPFRTVGEIEFRSALAGPLAVNTIVRFLGLEEVAAAEILGWYRSISDAIVALSVGGDVPDMARSAVEAIQERVASTLAERGHSSLIKTIESEGKLGAEELVPTVAVVMFGAIETSEGMTTNALWHLLTNPETLRRVVADRSLVSAAIDESLRLEPAAAVVDRYTTVEVGFGEVTIPKGDQVTISLLGANRDPTVFPDPALYDIDRPNLQQHVTFVEGPHRCIGLHLARAETAAAINAVLDQCDDLALCPDGTSPPEGLIFRKPAAVTATFSSAKKPRLGG